MMGQFDTPAEQRVVVQKMVDAVSEMDPLFFKNMEDAIPLEKTPEYRFFVDRARTPLASPAQFIQELTGRWANAPQD